MSFNRRGPKGRDDRPERGDRPQRDRFERPNRRSGGGGDWQPRERPGAERGGPPRGDRPYSRPAGDRPYGPRAGGDRPYAPRPRFEGSQDEGGMSIRLDPRRLGTLKQLAAEAGARPGDLVRIWVEERLDAERRGQPATGGAAPTADMAALLTALTERVAALEARSTTARAIATEDAPAEEPSSNGDAPKRRGRNRVSAKPTAERVALHDEITAVLAERGPLPAVEIASIIAERGRYVPPRSGKPLDAATVNARISNPTYRGRFTRSEGRIGLAEG